MSDHLEQQLINELRAYLQELNVKYKDFFHLEMITLCDMKDARCSECAESETNQQCKNCVIGYRDKE